jgi:uncharacterized membrane protein YkvA (DUF1232 family)
MSSTDSNEYIDSFSNSSFWDKLKNHAVNAGKGLVENGLILYYVWDDPDTPLWAKTAIIGALGYFISPIDAIPDIVPRLGYSDDGGVLIAAISAVAAHIKEEHRIKAKKTVEEYFG